MSEGCNSGRLASLVWHSELFMWEMSAVEINGKKTSRIKIAFKNEHLLLYLEAYFVPLLRI